VIKPPSLKRLQRIYFNFGEAIPTSLYYGDHECIQFCEEVRDKAKKALEKGIEMLKKKQEEDPDRMQLQRMGKGIRLLTKLYHKQRTNDPNESGSPEKKGEEVKDSSDGANVDKNNKFDLKKAFAEAFKELEDWNEPKGNNPEDEDEDVIVKG